MTGQLTRRALMGSAAALAAAPARAQTAAPIKVGFLTVKTGPLAAGGIQEEQGLTLFLATVGLNSGDDFVATVQGTGLQLLLAAAAIVLASVVTTLVVGSRLLRIPYDELLGVAAGVTGNPAILAFVDRAVQTERPDVSYAMIFPGTTIVKILLVQVIALL